MILIDVSPETIFILVKLYSINDVQCAKKPPFAIYAGSDQ